jgi:DNA-directed RNA polymerase I subunit RPA49
MEELREEKERIEAAKGSMTARRHALATEFGSRRSKKAIAEMAENAIAKGHGKDPQLGARDEAVSSAVLRNMESATGSMPTKEDLAAAVDSSKPRPLANLAAEYPSGVYTTDSIVGQDLMGIIPVKDWVDAANSGQDIQVHSQYVARKMLKLAKAKELQKLKVLRFILCCINFNAALKQRGKGPKTVPPKEQLMKAMGEDTPAPVVDSIKRRFASEYVLISVSS